MKKILIVISALFACLLIAAFAACRKPTEDVFGDYKDEVIAGETARITAKDGAGYLRWGAADDAESYDVYAADSLYGDYFKLNDKPLYDTKYYISVAPYRYFLVSANVSGGGKKSYAPVSVFGESTLVVSQTDDLDSVNAHIDNVHTVLEKGQFSSDRFALMFLPGEYDGVCAKVGYYTSVIGLGEQPDYVRIGSAKVSTEILGNNNATCTFWRSMENLTINSTFRWAVSQATSLRRMQICGNLELSHPDGWSSGGFLANSRVTQTVYPYTQQQWMSRNDDLNKWSGSGHNYVFSGCAGDIPQSVWTENDGRFTNIAATERIAEKPFLYYDGIDYKVFVPALQTNTRGITWGAGLKSEYGYSLYLDEFYIADPRFDNSETLNAALSAGKHLLFTPGTYLLDAPLMVNRENTVVMGIGYATLKLTDNNSEAALCIADIDGVRVCDLLVDAGGRSKNLVVVGENGKHGSHAANPAVLSNIYLRIGGIENVHTEVDTAMAIYSNDVVGDNFWIWRADHSHGVAWEDYTDGDGNVVYGNPANTGLLVEGDNVTIYALMVEHFKGYQTVWRGEGGTTVMYQSETPYRIIGGQKAWTAPDGKRGYSSYFVDEKVNTHRAYGIGIYLVNYNAVVLDSAITAPEKESVRLEHLVTCSFASGEGSVIENVVNGLGGAVGHERDFRRLVEIFGFFH